MQEKHCDRFHLCRLFVFIISLAGLVGGCPHVAEANQNPEINATPIRKVLGGTVYSYKVLATNRDGDAMSYALPLAPSGMTIDGNGEITWHTPQNINARAVRVTVEVTDGLGGQVSQSYTLAVIANTPTQISSSPVVSRQVSAAYQYLVRAEDQDKDKLMYKLMGAPADMLIQKAGPFDRIRWNLASAGHLRVTVVATNGRGGEDTQIIYLTVNPLPPDPAIVASRVAASAPSTIGATTAFLYGGAKPIQVGVAPNTIKVTSDGVVRGKVLSQSGGHFCHSAPVETDAFGFRPRANDFLSVEPRGAIHD
jgi:hypothetical protein